MSLQAMHQLEKPREKWTRRGPRPLHPWFPWRQRRSRPDEKDGWPQDQLVVSALFSGLSKLSSYVYMCFISYRNFLGRYTIACNICTNSKPQLRLYSWVKNVFMTFFRITGHPKTVWRPPGYIAPLRPSALTADTTSLTHKPRRRVALQPRHRGCCCYFFAAVTCSWEEPGFEPSKYHMTCSASLATAAPTVTINRNQTVKNAWDPWLQGNSRHTSISVSVEDTAALDRQKSVHLSVQHNSTVHGIVIGLLFLQIKKLKLNINGCESPGGLVDGWVRLVIMIWR